MGVYKYFSIKNSEDKLDYEFSIKNALAFGDGGEWGGGQL